jgi:HAE1 family hydrophobic/amphiphilic exporter-1
VETGQVYVRLVPKKERHINQTAFGEVMRKEVAQMGGATAAVYTSGFGGARKQIQVELRGKDARVLSQLADSVMKVVKTVPGAVDVDLSTRGQKPELEIELNRPLAGALGVTVGQVAQSLRPAFAGVDAGDWVDPSGENRKVRVRLSPESRTRTVDIQRLPLFVPSANGGPNVAMPLGQIATIKEGRGPALISHLDRDNVIMIEANVQGRSLGEVNTDITTKLASFTLPAGYRFTSGGEVKDQQEVFSRIFYALGVAVMLMYLILVIQFGSFLDPLAIMMSLPLSLIGVVLALIITRGTLNIMSMIGVILLMGIVAKNAILVVDFAKWAREKEGMSLRDALIEAGSIRLRPILMTTLALIAGMTPVAIGAGEGADFRAPLGRAVIGGVITSTVLTLLVIPTFYEIFDDWRSAFARRFGVKVKQHTGERVIPRGAVPEAGD